MSIFRNSRNRNPPEREKSDLSHSHGVIDPALYTSQRGIWCVKWSFFGLLGTAIFQFLIVLNSGSISLFADTVHNFGDAATGLPLWVAFILMWRKPSKSFTYGYGRFEDFAGAIIILTILATALVSGYASLMRLYHPQAFSHLPAVAGASVAGFLGNEAVAQFRIKTGKEIKSAALVADGYHARIDGLTSLIVLFGVLGTWLGYPLTDPVIGLIITLIIFIILGKLSRSIFKRMLDGVDPRVTEDIFEASKETPGVRDVSEVRVRWLGHRLHAEVNIAVDPNLSVEAGHEIAVETRHLLLHHLKYLSNATIHVDPLSSSGEKFHAINQHVHDQLPGHSH